MQNDCLSLLENLANVDTSLVALHYVNLFAKKMKNKKNIYIRKNNGKRRTCVSVHNFHKGVKHLTRTINELMNTFTIVVQV